MNNQPALFAQPLKTLSDRSLGLRTDQPVERIISRFLCLPQKQKSEACERERRDLRRKLTRPALPVQQPSGNSHAAINTEDEDQLEQAKPTTHTRMPPRFLIEPIADRDASQQPKRIGTNNRDPEHDAAARQQQQPKQRAD